MKNCVTGKNCYDSKELATEALIQNRIRNRHRDGSGPINIYKCKDCDHWHFTSKGEIADFLKEPDVIKRIEKERRTLDWGG